MMPARFGSDAIILDLTLLLFVTLLFLGLPHARPRAGVVVSVAAACLADCRERFCCADDGDALIGLQVEQVGIT